MKTKFLLIALFGIITFGSCTQEYICQCEISYEGSQPGLPEPVVKEFFIKDTHDEAAAKCEANSTEITSDNITMKEACRLF
jgi:hypothetical protein